MRPLQFHNFSLKFGNRTILNQINLQVAPQGIHAVLGPSGCGKSTLLLKVAGLLPESANLTTSGQCQVRASVGIVFQKPYPFSISIFENVSLALKERGLRGAQLSERVEKALTLAGLWSEVKDRLNESALILSGGQQQRLCLARVLALEPELLLLDEPCSSLDPISTKSIESTLRELGKRIPILIVTHNLAQAQRIADHITLLWGGAAGSEVIEDGACEQVFMRSQSSVAKDYFSGVLG